LATNTERRTPFDLRTTIPLAKATLVSLARKPKRSWLIPFLTLITGVTFATMMLELMFSPGPLSALAFEGELRSKLFADYGADPLGAKIHELRLTIMDEVLGGGKVQSSGPAPALPELNDPVPTATAADQLGQTPTTEPATAVALTASDNPMVVPTATASNTPFPTAVPLSTGSPTAVPSVVPSNTPNPTAVPTTAAALNCSKLSILSISINGDDKLRAEVRNQASVKAFLTATTVEWPQVPPPAYVDWFKFDGNQYYDGNDNSSPTSKTGTNLTLNAGKTRTWEADWDDEPAEGLYGNFSVTLVLKISGEFCTLNSSAFKDPPATPVPSPTPVPPTETAPAPTGTPVLTETPASTPTPSETPTPAPTPT
jgi:hypothetical protein